mgnify:CR=1 FL=1
MGGFNLSSILFGSLMTISTSDFMGGGGAGAVCLRVYGGILPPAAIYYF